MNTSDDSTHPNRPHRPERRATPDLAARTPAEPLAKNGLAGPARSTPAELAGATQALSAASGPVCSAQAPSAASGPACPGQATPSPAPQRVLVVDDEVAIAELVAHLLRDQGLDVATCYGGTAALSTFERAQAGYAPFDLVILDIMMPGLDGLEVCCEIRRSSEVPIIFLSARDEEADKVAGLMLGADDYVTKPFRPREFVARVKARLRRSRMAGGASAGGAPGQASPGEHPEILAAHGIELDPRAHVATLYGQELRLTPKEFGVLEQLLRRVGQPVSNRELFESVWEEAHDLAASETVMVHIRRLRRKLAELDGSQTFIETVWGVGYKIPPEPCRERRPAAPHEANTLPGGHDA